MRTYTPFVIGFELVARCILPKRPHILIACMPKSGSTFLAHALAEYDGLRRTRLVPAYGQREQELCELRLTRYNMLSYVSQHHVRNSGWTQELIRRYHLKPFVLVRNLFDCVVSIRDHLRRETDPWPIAHFTKHHVALPDHELEDAIVQLAMPWYLNFYAGWRQDQNALFIHYEEMIVNPQNVIEMVLDRAGIPTSADKISAALAAVKTKHNRLNKGISGRGQDLRPETRRKLLAMINLYPEYHDDTFFRDMLQNESAGKHGRVAG